MLSVEEAFKVVEDLNQITMCKTGVTMFWLGCGQEGLIEIEFYGTVVWDNESGGTTTGYCQDVNAELLEKCLREEAQNIMGDIQKFLGED
jgi:hypothetical protein